MSNIQKIFKDAVEYIKIHGWCQNAATKSTGEVCLNTSLVINNDSLGDIMRAQQIFMDNISNPCSIVFWNDHVCKTKEEAIAALESLAALPLD